jgi:four helix bundle protein
MKYSRFEDLPVWQAAIDMSVKIFCITEDPAFRFKGDVANQIQRAGLSVSNNIAEGFERGTTQELLTFLYYARGSAGEVRSIFYVIERVPALQHLKDHVGELKVAAESISRQLKAWADSLQNSDFTGTRYVTEKSKQSFQEQKRAQSLMDQLKREHEERIRKMVEEREKRNPPPAE